jgi:hypothetical protein
VRAQVQANAGPGVEVIACGDGSADALGGADGPVLLEGSGAFDRWSVCACAHVNIVCSAIAGDGAFLGGAGRRVVGAVRFDDVILDERVGGPAVDSKIAVTIGAVSARIGDGSGRRYMSTSEVSSENILKT